MSSLRSMAHNINRESREVGQSHCGSGPEGNCQSLGVIPRSSIRGSCPVCKAESHHLWSAQTWHLPFSQVRFGLAECNQCQTIFCVPRPTPAQLERLYTEFYDYHWFEQRLLFKKIQGWHRWRRLRGLLKELRQHKGRLLDVGCGHGLFLIWAKRDGWDAVGIDYPSAATRYARERLGLHIFESDVVSVIHDRCEDIGSFDLVTLWHCLEHSIDPLVFGSYVTQLLKPSGKILIAVPNGLSQGMRLKRERWVWCQEPFVHTVHFTPNSLIRLADRIGLRCLSVWSRDTWDANRLFDIYLNVWVWRMSSILKGRISGKIGFLFEEACRLACYSIGGFRHWGLGCEAAPENGSELLFLGERGAV